jgi:lipoprotein-anchoring transpeptidase ErfK/SrfK
VDGYFGDDDYAAVLAFQKVNGLARTGAVTPDLWRRLAAAHVPLARYPGTHVEVDKTRQVLFIVRDGKVTEVVHVSTGATGNTPVGLWHVYSKVPGWSWVLWYPNFFLRGFAIHGYPSVPAYPASHGCVRVPMWVAPSLYAQIPGGFPVYVYY